MGNRRVFIIWCIRQRGSINPLNQAQVSPAPAVPLPPPLLSGGETPDVFIT